MRTPGLQLKAAHTVDILGSSYGRVSTREQLYDPKIFGAQEDLRCNCGKYQGEEVVGIICDECGVKIVADAAAGQRRRLGHVGLPPFCGHPLDESVFIQEFPVAPLGFRVLEGEVNALGRKYERLVEIAGDLQTALPKGGWSVEYAHAARALDLTELREVMKEIIGLQEASPSRESLLGLLLESIIKLDASVHALIQSCGCVVEISTVI